MRLFKEQAHGIHRIARKTEGNISVFPRILRATILVATEDSAAFHP